ncbi:MAG TPA: histidine-type phosphatase [Rhizomicrobium sp.]|nr:histidine-type phosphatase [Rhizomicrobium sp.]
MRYPGLLLALVLCTSGASAAPVLEKVLILERHGVRPPTKPPEAFAKYASQPWPQWPVAPGELTPHGAEAMRAMGAGLRARYRSVLPGKACASASSVFVWADNANQRTRESGKAIAATLAPGCAIPAHWAPQDSPDPLFHGACRIDKLAAASQLSAVFEAMMKTEGLRYSHALATLNQILMPGCTGDSCPLSGETRVTASGKIEGPLSTAATLSENLLLEYAQGFPDKDVGWGRAASPAKIAAVMPLHEMDAELARATPLLAARNGSLLAEQIAAFLGAPDHGTNPVPASARLVVLLGHDTNLSNIEGLLGVRWHLPQQPDSTAPGTALAFEVWRDHERETVRVVALYQTLDQLRSAAPLNGGPMHVNISVPDCSSHSCAPDAVAARLMRAVPPACLNSSPEN